MYAGPVSRISMEPTARIHCTGERECSQIDLVNTSSPMVHDWGKCSALLTRDGFFDFLVCTTQCNVRHSVAVVCQHNMARNFVFSNTMSDVTVSLVNGFQSIQIFSSCDPGWFMVDDVCISFYHCPGCRNNMDAREQCSVYGGQLAYNLLNNVTIHRLGIKLYKSIKLSLFWGMFPHLDDISSSIGNTGIKNRIFFTKHQKYFAVNGSALCVGLSNSSECKDSNIVLAVGFNAAIFNVNDETCFNLHPEDPRWLYNKYLWSVIHQPTFEITEYKHMSLCEKPVVHAVMLTDCSEFYLSCNDGTCIHDSLVCDGHSHCPHGKDEADCKHICFDHSHNCMSHCHHRDLCFCSLEYFQCLSGGCVPLQKQCDQSFHCIDASDEPPTCVYLRPGHRSLSLDINNYINSLMQHNIVIQHRCLQSSNNMSLLHVQNVSYKMHCYWRSRVT